MNVIEAVAGVLESIGAPYALIEARAVGARGFPRMTLDYDFLTSDERILRREIWRPLEQAGATADPRKGDYDDPIAGVVGRRADRSPGCGGAGGNGSTEMDLRG